jgi:hypothetical protein
VLDRQLQLERGHPAEHLGRTLDDLQVVALGVDLEQHLRLGDVRGDLVELRWKARVSGGG